MKADFHHCQLPPSFPVEPGQGSFALRLRLITPLYGGGVRPGEVSVDEPFAPTGIKHQIRWWWRRLARFGCLPQVEGTAGPLDGEALYQREAQLFGGAVRANDEHAQRMVPSRIRVTVSNVNLASTRSIDADDAQLGALKFVLFSAYPQKRLQVLAKELLAAGASFTLTVECPESERLELAEAIRWWVQLGGLGARTRRGCGSLALDGRTAAPSKMTTSRSDPEAHTKVIERVGRYLDAAEAAKCKIMLKALPMPTAPGVPRHFSGATKAWGEAVEWLRRYRQGHDAREFGKELIGDPTLRLTREGAAVRPLGTSGAAVSYRPGRTKWPEADNVRHVGGLTNAAGYAMSSTVDHMPRAALGLPIRGDQINQAHGSKATHAFDIQLELAQGKTGRLPSPISIKARSIGPGSGYEAIALLFEDQADSALQQTVLISVTPKQLGNHAHADQHSHVPVWDSNKPMPYPMQVLGSGTDPDPLRAFMTFFGDPAKANDW